MNSRRHTGRPGRGGGTSRRTTSPSTPIRLGLESRCPVSPSLADPADGPPASKPRFEFGMPPRGARPSVGHVRGSWAREERRVGGLGCADASGFDAHCPRERAASQLGPMTAAPARLHGHTTHPAQHRGPVTRPAQSRGAPTAILGSPAHELPPWTTSGLAQPPDRFFAGLEPSSLGPRAVSGPLEVAPPRAAPAFSPNSPAGTGSHRSRRARK